jgi:elongation factor G
MPRSTPVETRNIGIMAHIDAGKTTTTERILFYTGRQLQDRRSSRRYGHDGLDGAGAGARHHDHVRGDDLLLARVSDQHHRYSGSRRLHDRSGALAAGAGRRRAVFVASAGVEPQSETVWRQADKYRVPRIAFVNKMDRMGADFFAGLDDRRRLAGSPVPMQLPMGLGRHARASSTSSAKRSPTKDETMGAKYELGTSRGIPQERGYAELRDQLVEASPSRRQAPREVPGRARRSPNEELKAAIRVATITNRLQPVVCGSAFKNKGVQPLLDAVVDYLPSPPRTSAGHLEPGTDKTIERKAPKGAVRGSGLQDHDRSVRRAARVPPRLLRPCRIRRRACSTPPRARRSASVGS